MSRGEVHWLEVEDLGRRPVLVLTAVAAVGAVLGARVGHRVSGARLQAAFAVLVLVVAMYTTVRAVPEVLGGLLPT